MAKKFDPKAKARKQKIILGVLGVVFLGVLAFQAPTILGVLGGGSSEVASEPAPPPSVPTAPAPGAPAPAAAPAPGTSELVDSDLTPEPTQGQLVTFDRFESKDPFAQQADGPPGGTAPAEPATPNVNEPPEDLGPEPQAPSGPATTVSTAEISVNGVTSEVAVSATFPEGDPIFKLVSLKKTTAKVGIVDGTYSTGTQAITLKKGGKPVTLMNTADGTTYVLRLISVG